MAKKKDMGDSDLKKKSTLASANKKPKTVAQKKDTPPAGKTADKKPATAKPKASSISSTGQKATPKIPGKPTPAVQKKKIEPAKKATTRKETEPATPKSPAKALKKTEKKPAATAVTTKNATPGKTTTDKTKKQPVVKKTKTTPAPEKPVRKTTEPTGKKPPVKKVTTKKPSPKEPLKENLAPSSTSGVFEVESAKFEMGPREKPFQEPAPVSVPRRELPESYNDTKVTLLVRDPEWIFAYWDINQKTREEHRIPRGRHDKTMALRVYDFTGVEVNKDNPHRHYDVIINDFSTSWYLRMPEVNRTWCVDLGYYDKVSGEFVALVRSNTVTTPSAGLSPEGWDNIEWMLVNQEHYEELIRLSGGLANIMELRGSENFMRAVSERIRMKVEQSAGASGILSSGQAVKKAPAAGKDFWLVVNTDLIVYGATEPNARVTIQDQPVELRKDGTFSVRFTLQDGTITIPVKAINADGDMKREIVPHVKKETH